MVFFYLRDTRACSYGGTDLAKPNYSFEKRQRELAKKKKQEQKRQKKAADKSDKDVTSADSAPAVTTDGLPPATP